MTDFSFYSFYDNCDFWLVKSKNEVLKQFFGLYSIFPSTERSEHIKMFFTEQCCNWIAA